VLAPGSWLSCPDLTGAAAIDNRAAVHGVKKKTSQHLLLQGPSLKNFFGQHPAARGQCRGDSGYVMCEVIAEHITNRNPAWGRNLRLDGDLVRPA